MEIKDIECPEPADDEILVKVFASTVNRTDCGFRSAEYFISRFWSGLFKPKHRVLGCEFAGRIESIGAEVTSFEPGDRIFGYNDERFGGHAEYLTITEDGAIATIPEGFSYEGIVPSTEGAHYALCNIRTSKVASGQNALVYGATGAIGSAAVQLLEHFGVNVTAVGNTKNMELVHSLGAQRVIDHQTQDFTKTEDRFDFVFDAVGKSSFKECRPLMKAKGVYISTELGKNGSNVWRALIAPLSKGKKVLFPLPTIEKADVEFLKELIEQKEFRPVIDEHYELDDIVKAYRYVESGQKTGNVVLTIPMEDGY